MAIEIADAYVSIVPSARGFAAKLSEELGLDGIAAGAGDSSGRSFSSGFLAHIGKIAVAATGALAAIGVGKILADSVGAASDLNESVTKTRVVFGDSAKGIEEWAGTAASSLGQSKQQALEATSTFGNLFRAMGIATPAAADMSTNIVTLASDLASFNNVKPEEALIALKAGLVGETEPLRRFGVNINDARLKAEALRLGLVEASVDSDKLSQANEAVDKSTRKVADALNKYGADSVQYKDAVRDQEQANAKLSDVLGGKVPATLDAATKAQAAYSLIQHDTALAQGDFARTSDGLANKQRILSAQFADAKAQIGTGLLPIVTALATVVSERVIPAFTTVGEAIAPVVAALGGALLDAFSSLSGSGGTFEAIAGGAKSLVDAVKDFDFKAFFGPLISSLASLGGNAFDFITQALGTIVRLAVDNKDTLTTLATIIKTTLVGATTALSAVFGFLADNMGLVKAIVVPLTAAFVGYKVVTLSIELATKAVTLATRIWAAAQAALNVVMNLNPIGIVIGLIAALAAGIFYAYTHFEGFRNVVQAVWDGIKAAFSWIADNWPTLLAILTGPIGVAALIIIKNWDTIKDAFAAAWDFIKGMIGATVGWFSDMAQRSWAFVSGLYQNIKDGIVGAVRWIGDRISEIVGFYASIPGRVLGFITSVYDAIRNGISYAKDWIGYRIDDVVGFFTSIPGRVGNVFSGIFDGALDALRWVVNGIANLWNSTVGALSFHIPSWVPAIGGRGFDVPDIPYLAKGGIATEPTLAFLAEAGPEVIMPLADLRHILGALPAQVPDGGTNIVVNAKTQADARQVAREVRWAQITAGV